MNKETQIALNKLKDLIQKDGVFYALLFSLFEDSHISISRLDDYDPNQVTVEHQEDSQAENYESKDKEEPEEILYIVSEVDTKINTIFVDVKAGDCSVSVHIIEFRNFPPNY